jgi:hypothetical protein
MVLLLISRLILFIVREKYGTITDKFKRTIKRSRVDRAKQTVQAINVHYANITINVHYANITDKSCSADNFCG